MEGRVVLHSDLNNCYASIECMLHGKHGAYDCVLIVDPSRLSRSAEGCALIGQKLNRHGIRVYTPQGKIQLAPPHAFFYSRYHKEGENDLGPGK